MEIKSKDIQIVDINKLIPYEKNPNKHPKEQIERLKKLIKSTGFRQPLIVQAGTNVVACGHGRLTALKEMGVSQVPVIYQEFKTEEELYSFVTSDNAISNWSKLDFAQINTDIGELGPFDIELLGIKSFEVEALDGLEIDDPDPKDKKEKLCPHCNGVL